MLLKDELIFSNGGLPNESVNFFDRLKATEFLVDGFSHTHKLE